MRIGVKGFRGMAPRLAPHELPPNAAQQAVNARLQSGDLEAWRQFVETERLAIAPQTIYLLNDRWMAWASDVDVARSPVAGDTSYRVFLTGPDEYDEPRWTNYSLAFQSPGGTPPVVTRPLGVPASDSAPTLVVGVDSSPTTFSIDTLDDNASLASRWATNPELDSSGRIAIVDQQTGYYRVRYDENRDPGQEAYAYRNFGVAGVSVLQVSMDFNFAGDTGYLQAAMIVGAQLTGAGIGVVYDNGVLSIRKPASWGVNFGTAVLSQETVSPALSYGTTYTMQVVAVTNTDGTKTVTAKLFNTSTPTATELASLTVTNNFEDGDYCGFANGAVADAATVFETDYSGFHVQASGSTNATVVNVATSYVYTLVNDLGEESAPSPASATILRPDGVSVTVTTPTTVPTGVSSEYGIETKRIYRAVTGATGSIFRFVAEIDLATADYVDTLTDAQLGEALESEGWDLPPDDLRGILALPNGIMVGFRENQLCFSAQNRPHAWPPAYRLNTDTAIVGIGAIDTAVVVGTHTFPYVAQGQSPDAYAAAKLEVPQAAVSKRSFAYLANVGVCFASPDGYLAVAGVAAPVNLTRGIFTRKQWQALRPESIVGVAHDDVLHFFYDSESAVVAIGDASGQSVNGATFTLNVTRTGSTAFESTVDWTAAGDLYEGSGTEGFFNADGYSGSITFGVGVDTVPIEFTLFGDSSFNYSATVTLSNPSAGTTISDATGALAATAFDPFFANVGYLLHLDDPTNPFVFTDVKGNAWAREGTNQPANFTISGGNPKFGSGSLLMKTGTGSSTDYGIAALSAVGDYSLGTGNKFTIEGWLYWTGNIDSRPCVGQVISDAGTVLAEIQFNTTNQIRFTTNLSANDDRIVSPPLNQWIHVAMSYDGTTKYWFVNGVLQGSAAVAVGATRTVRSYRCRGTASGGAPPNAWVDDLRFTFGVCRYTASFAPPTAPFPNA